MDKVSELARGRRKEEPEEVVLLAPAPELSRLPLEGLCQRPVQTHREEDSANSKYLPKILSPLLLGGKRREVGKDEKWYYSKT